MLNKIMLRDLIPNIINIKERKIGYLVEKIIEIT